jgi:hypothetical protein
MEPTHGRSRTMRACLLMPCHVPMGAPNWPAGYICPRHGIFEPNKNHIPQETLALLYFLTGPDNMEAFPSGQPMARGQAA